MGLELTTDRV